MLTRKDVEHVALLARLKLKPEEIEVYTRQLQAILDYAARLNELNTDEVPPTAHVLPLINVWREDEVGVHMPIEDVLSNAPDSEERYFRVPRVI